MPGIQKLRPELKSRASTYSPVALGMINSPGFLPCTMGIIIAPTPMALVRELTETMESKELDLGLGAEEGGNMS